LEGTRPYIYILFLQVVANNASLVYTSPVKNDKKVLETIGKKLKKNNVALDIVDFGESDDEKPEKLEALIAAVNSSDNSHIVHAPPGENALSDVLLR
jgi:26S proteasome regulatory subunit N10